MKQAEFVYSLNVTASLKQMKPHQQLTFIIAGEGKQCSLSNIYMLARKWCIPCRIEKSDNDTKATVTRLPDAEKVKSHA